MTPKTKKTLIIIAVIIVLAIIGKAIGGKKAPAPAETPKEAETTAPAVDLAKDELTVENVETLAKAIFDRADEVKVTVENGVVDVVYYDSEPVSEKQVATDNIKGSVKLAEEVFKNDAAEELRVTCEADMNDAKGANTRDWAIAESFTRESIDGVDWDNFSGMLLNDPMKIQGITQSFNVQPFILETIQK